LTCEQPLAPALQITVNECWTCCRKKKARPLVYESDFFSEEQTGNIQHRNAKPARARTPAIAWPCAKAWRLCSASWRQTRPGHAGAEGSAGFSVEEIAESMGVNANTREGQAFSPHGGRCGISRRERKIGNERISECEYVVPVK